MTTGTTEMHGGLRLIQTSARLRGACDSSAPPSNEYGRDGSVTAISRCLEFAPIPGLISLTYSLAEARGFG